MGRYAQAGIFRGNLMQFNEFLAKEEQNGSVYIESKPIKDVGFYVVMRRDVGINDNESIGEEEE